MVRHLQSSIEGLLRQTDNVLENLFAMKGKEVRADLLEQKAKGHLLIGSDRCEGFDPIYGCPGHAKVNGKELTIRLGLDFYNINMPGYSFVVTSVNLANKTLVVRITNNNPPYEQRTEKDWKLQETQWAFENGEYFLPQ